MFERRASMRNAVIIIIIIMNLMYARYEKTPMEYCMNIQWLTSLFWPLTRRTNTESRTAQRFYEKIGARAFARRSVCEVVWRRLAIAWSPSPVAEATAAPAMPARSLRCGRGSLVRARDVSPIAGDAMGPPVDSRAVKPQRRVTAAVLPSCCHRRRWLLLLLLLLMQSSAGCVSNKRYALQDSKA
jgi:hypothetical protein